MEDKISIKIIINLLKIFNNKYFFPFDDNYFLWDSIDNAMNTIDLHVNKKHSVIKWDYETITSDKTISDIAFIGIGAIDIIYDDKTNLYISNYSFLENYEVRKSFEKYGAIAYFNNDTLDVIKIYWCHSQKNVYPNDSEWEHVKWAYRVSVFFTITLKNHLIETHLLYSNSGSFIGRNLLNSNHPIRRLIHPFNHMASHVIINSIISLYDNNGIFARSLGFTNNGYSKIVDDLLKQVKYKKYLFNTEITNKLGIKYPYGYYGLKYHTIVNTFVKNYIESYYNNITDIYNDEFLMKILKHIVNDPLFDTINEIHYNTIIEIMTNYIVQVTGIHSFVGDVSEYFSTPNFMGPRIRPNINMADVRESFSNILIYAISSDNSSMLLDNYEYLLLKDNNYNSTLEFYKKFKYQLNELSDEINKNNQLNKNNLQINVFDPKLMAISAGY